ncbi:MULTISPECIES: fibronectin type III domain-containing protein [unclassified Streptomyces]|uniref:fibronectin type III domain-containing protein n=1 Tax=unclassified Streptomyces TaxID=2593676 RepID=UPI0009A0B17D|nr:discoidin domain-containing protein [Streptomyces sp. TSRI0281]
MEASRRTVIRAGLAGAGAALISVSGAPGRAFGVNASAGEPLTVNIDPGTAAPLAPNFGGYNPDFQVVGMNFGDPQAASLARELRTGTLRYPSGTDADYFDLRSGDVRPEWAAQFFGKMTAFDTSQDDAHVIGAKPDLHRLAGFKALLDDIRADTVIIINGFTDTPESAAAIAGYCLANSIRVAAYELSNEGWLLPTFFMDATDYAARMKPYYDAIKAVDPAAQVNVMFSQGEAPAWDQALGAYPDKYWDGISFHMYGGGDRYSTFDDAVKDLNTRLADRTNSYVDSYYLAKGRPDMRVFVSEFNSTPSTMTALSTSGIIRTLYNGIFAAEFVTRLSAHPNVDRVMLHGLVQFGTTFTKPYLDTMKSVHERGETLDTTGFDYGIVRHGSALGLAVCLDAINRSSHTLTTSTSEAVVTVPKHGGTVPAVHTQAYVGLDGYDSLVITNKSATAHALTLQWGGVTLPGPFDTLFISSDDPRAENTAAAPGSIAMTEGSASGVVEVPAYSVMRVRWRRARASLDPAFVTRNGANILSTRPNGRRVTVAWTPALGAGDYLVRCRDANGTVVKRRVTRKTEAAFAGLALGRAYEFTVTPLTKKGQGAASPPCHVLLAAPSAPLLDVAAPGDGCVNVSWQPVVGANSYTVRHSANGSEHTIDAGNAIGLRVRGIANGEARTFTVQAVNGYGESSASNALVATPGADVPYAPHTVLAAAGSGGTAVWWKPSYKRIASSNLESGSGDWTLNGPWEVVSLPGADGPLAGGIGMSKRLAISGSGLALFGPDVATHHFVGAELAFSPPLSGSAGLVLRYSDANNYLFAVFDFATTKHCIGRVLNGETTILGSTPAITDPYAMPTAGRQVTYRFELNAATLALFRDGGEVLRVSSGSLQDSAPGRAGAISDGSSVNVDRLHVEADTATGFDVLRAEGPAGPYTVVASNHPDLSLVDTASSGAGGYYKVVAVTGGVRSADASHPAPSRLRNIAREATITASSTLAGTATAKLVDGITNLDSSRWVSQPGEPHDLEFAWASAKTIGRVCVHTGFMANKGFQVADFELQQWDGATWRTVTAVVGNDRDVYAGTFNDLSFVPVTTKSVRLHITKACAAPGYTNARVLEVEIYGK